MADFYGKMKAERIGLKPVYKVLQSQMVRGTEKERAASIASYVTTDEEACKLAGHEGFAYKGLDLRGRCGVVTYRGIEVMLLFKREIIEITSGPADPVPERPLRDPADAWIQINLLNTELGEKEKSLANRLKHSLESVTRLEMLWKSSQNEVKNLTEMVEGYAKDKAEIQETRKRLALIEEQVKRSDLLEERSKVQLRAEKDGRREDRVKVVQELFPVFNTLWLAGIHRESDPLYNMLKKQLVDALVKVGAELLEPQIGDEFDPQLHHAVHSYEFEAGAIEIGSIVQVNRVGWKLSGGPVVEAAEVAVGVEKKIEEIKLGGV